MSTQRFHAGPEWQHYTGTVEASLAAQRGFNVWRGDKMSHMPVMLLRAAAWQTLGVHRRLCHPERVSTALPTAA